MKTKITGKLLFICLGLVTFALLGDALAATEYSRCDFTTTVDIYPATTSADSVTAYIACASGHPGTPSTSPTIMLIHGLAHNSGITPPVMDEILNAYPDSQVLALDTIGHGQTLPRSDHTGVSGKKYGETTLEDQVELLYQVITALMGTSYQINVLGGHSMGGEIVFMLQQRLINESSSLDSAFGIADVLLFAPVIPEGKGLIWSKLPSITAQLLSYLEWSPEDGYYGTFPEEDWIFLFFTDGSEDAVPVTGAPDVPYVEGNDLNNDEPFAEAAEMGGLDSDLKRPIINPGIFSSGYGTSLATIAFENDPFLLPQEICNLHRYLLNEKARPTCSASRGFYLSKYDLNLDEPAVHDSFYPQPERLMDALNYLIR